MWARLTVSPSSQREMTDQVDKSSKNVGRTVTSRTDEKARRALHAWSCANAITASCWDIFPRRLNADGAAPRKYWTSKGVRAAEGNRRDAVALVRRASIRARSRRGSTMSRSGSFRACTCVVHIATVA